MTTEALSLLRCFIWARLVPRVKSRATTSEYSKGYYQACEDITKLLKKVQA